MVMPSSDKNLNVERLIELVRGMESLYNPRNSDYKDVQLTRNLWRYIGGVLGVDGETAKKKWWSKRDVYIKLRNLKAKRGPASEVKLRKWKWYPHLTFLEPFLKDISTSTNLQQQHRSKTTDEKQGTWAIGDVQDAQETQDIKETQEAEDNQETQDHCCEPLCFECEDGKDRIRASMPPMGSLSTFSAPLFGHSSTLTRLQNRTKLRKAADNFQAFMKTRQIQQEQQQQERGWRIEEFHRDLDDPIDSFFHSMAQSVKRLPLDLQAEVKMKVCQVVADAEVQHYMMPLHVVKTENAD
uniref:uncharacterized protein n=1 Tax=Myxine glutinosa TaxID=7769 RepID=UPI00358DFD04